MAVPLRRYPERSDASPPVLSPMSGVALVIVGALAIAAAIAALAVMHRDPASNHPGEPAPVVVQPLIEHDGGWERIEVAPTFAVTDLRATSFGLVAAAGKDGVWLSDDGLEWRQALTPPAEELPGTDPSVNAETTIPGHILGTVKAVAEFDSALYAFGTVSRETGIDSEAWLVVWNSADGSDWERVNIAKGWDQVMDVATGAEGITVFVRTAGDTISGPECCSTGIYRSAAGGDWQDLSRAVVGLDGVQVWAATAFADGYLAIGSNTAGDQLFTSADGLVWDAGPAWSDAISTGLRSLDLHSSAWSIIDLFESPDGVMAVLFSERSHSVVLLTSEDGAHFTRFGDGSTLLHFTDERNQPWPPLTAPEGVSDGDQIVLLGEWFPESADTPCTHLWRWASQEVSETRVRNASRW